MKQIIKILNTLTNFLWTFITFKPFELCLLFFTGGSIVFLNIVLLLWETDNGLATYFVNIRYLCMYMYVWPIITRTILKLASCQSKVCHLHFVYFLVPFRPYIAPCNIFTFTYVWRLYPLLTTHPSPASHPTAPHVNDIELRSTLISEILDILACFVA
jgi:hypothetical protein